MDVETGVRERSGMRKKKETEIEEEKRRQKRRVREKREGMKVKRG